MENVTIYSYNGNDTTSTPVMNIMTTYATLLINNTINVNKTTKVVKAQLVLYDVLIPTLGALIIVLNLAVVVSSGLLLKKGKEPRATYMFLGNVAMTDLTTGIAVVFGQVFPIAYRNHEVCAFQIGLIVSSTLASVYSVGLIAVDRFLYILYGLQYKQWVYPTKVRLMIGGTWILGCAIGFLPLMGWYGDTKDGRICWFILVAPKHLILLTVLFGIIPLLTVVVLYSVILYHAIKKIMQLKNSESANEGQSGGSNVKNLRMFRGKAKIDDSVEVLDEEPKKKGFIAKFFKKAPESEANAPKKWKAIKVVLFTTGSFICTWCPYFVVSLYYVYTCNSINDSKQCKSLSILIASPLAILGFINSLVNPVIYAWWHKGFQTFVRKRLSTFRFRSSRSEDISKSTKTSSVSNRSSKKYISKSNSTTSETPQTAF